MGKNIPSVALRPDVKPQRAKLPDWGGPGPGSLQVAVSVRQQQGEFSSCYRKNSSDGNNAKD